MSAAAGTGSNLSPQVLIPDLRTHTSPTKSEAWTFFGRPTQRSKIEFVFQVVILYFVIGFCLLNLTLGAEQQNLWTALLASSLGYILPSPTLKQKRKNE